MEHFEHEDLLVIDCLKPAVDLLNQFCRADAGINKSLQDKAQESLQQFLNDGFTDQDYQNQDVSAQIFVGILLIRRALPDISLQIKHKACLRGIQHCQQLHAIVFEEVAKLIIGVCYDDYEQMSTFKYIGNSTLEDTFSIVQD